MEYWSILQANQTPLIRRGSILGSLLFNYFIIGLFPTSYNIDLNKMFLTIFLSSSLSKNSDPTSSSDSRRCHRYVRLLDEGSRL